MVLKRVTVTGFKSFAAKTVLDLGPGITAVVGPNGSGKSNLADAVRWALGEQSKGRLRLGDREEVVFAGTDQRAKASFAEVVLLFDNQDGSFPLDLTEVEIGRRLYRSGETDYRLAGRSVRLADIQALLAQAGLGANSYAVIGQGTIDSFLQSSPAERKLLFDEAAGIRGPELSRDTALRKLAATEANLTRLRDIAAELSPRLASLERSVAGAHRGEELSREVDRLRAAVAAAQMAHWTTTGEALAAQLKEAAATVHRLRHEQAATAAKLDTARAKAAGVAAERDQLQASVAGLEHGRDQLALELTRAQSAVAEAQRQAAQAKILGQELTAAQTALAGDRDRQTDLEAELITNTASATRALSAVERAGREVARVSGRLAELRHTTDDGSRDQYIHLALQILKSLAVNLASEEPKMAEIRLLVHKAGRLLSHAVHAGAAELLAAIQTAQTQLEAAMAKRETAVEHQTNITITRRSLEIDLAHQQDATARAVEQVAGLTARLKPAQAGAAALPDLRAAARRAEAALSTATTALERQRRRVQLLAASSGGHDDQAALAAALERAKAAAAAAEARQTQLEPELAAAQAALAAARARARDWGITTPGPAPATPLDELTASLVRAEAQFEAQGQAHQEQLAEYEVVSGRAGDLSNQIADLEAAGANLQRVVSELDRLIQLRFKDNFQALAGQFSHFFARLFDGGKASLELEAAPAGGYGIVIKASPAGKRLASVAALSGGERALAGVALLAAILSVNPAPFVVLDEADAALDEANSGRLATILAELSHHTQLIVITHNRQIMQAAGVLFGVTTGAHQISHLVSLRLEAATELAAR